MPNESIPSNITIEEPTRTGLDIYSLLSVLFNCALLPRVVILGAGAAWLSGIIFLKRLTGRNNREVLSLNIWLLALCVYDFLLLVMSGTVFTSMFACDRLQLRVSCSIFDNCALVAYPLLKIAQGGSVWVCVALAVDRYIAVNYPLHRRSICSARNTMAALTTLSFGVILFRLTAFFELGYSEEAKQVLPTPFMKDKDYMFYYTYILNTLFIFIIPWTIMIILDVSVLLIIRRTKRQRQQLTKKRSSESGRTILAMLVVITFLVFNMPISVVNIIEYVFFSVQQPPWFVVLVSINTLLVCVNSATNFAIYCAIDQKFRHEFLGYLCCQSGCFVANRLRRDRGGTRTSFELESHNPRMLSVDNRTRQLRQDNGNPTTTYGGVDSGRGHSVQLHPRPSPPNARTRDFDNEHSLVNSDDRSDMIVQLMDKNLGTSNTGSSMRITKTLL